MSKAQRLSVILGRVAERGSVDVGDLAKEFGVSDATVRRDLQSLSRNKMIIRTHGGAISTHVGEVPARVKAVLHRAEKERIGHAAADLVADGAVVGMTGGSTVLELARALSTRRNITVVTNAINVAAELAEHSSLRLVVIGGLVRRSFELVGPAAEAMLSNYHLDVAFIGVDGLTDAEGCTTYDEMEAQTDRAFLENAQRRVVVTDDSKIGRVTFARICHLSTITDIVTNNEADVDSVTAFRASGVHVTTA